MSREEPWAGPAAVAAAAAHPTQAAAVAAAAHLTQGLWEHWHS